MQNTLSKSYKNTIKNETFDFYYMKFNFNGINEYLMLKIKYRYLKRLLEGKDKFIKLQRPDRKGDMDAVELTIEMLIKSFDTDRNLKLNNFVREFYPEFFI